MKIIVNGAVISLTKKEQAEHNRLKYLYLKYKNAGPVTRNKHRIGFQMFLESLATPTRFAHPDTYAIEAVYNVPTIENAMPKTETI